MAYTEILTSYGVTVSQWENRIAAEYIGQLWMKNLMGPSMDAVIQVKQDLAKMPGDAINIGAPHVAGATVVGEIASQDRGPHVIIFKKRRRKNSRRKRGYRDEITVLRITEILTEAVKDPATWQRLALVNGMQPKPDAILAEILRQSTNCPEHPNYAPPCRPTRRPVKAPNALR